MGKRAVLKNIDLFTDADELEKAAPEKRKDKYTPAEKSRRNRHHQKEVVRQLIQEVKKISTHNNHRDIEEDVLDERSEDQKKTSRIFYTIKPVN
jgi:hypothetical protein